VTSLGPRPFTHATGLVVAMAALVVGGFLQELFLLSGHPDLGISVVIPLVILVAWLWRPGWPVVGIIGISLGVELLLPLQTGGGRYQDWLLHYQMTLHYAGQPSHILASGLQWRTPLYHQLNAGILAYSPDYWTLQVGSVLVSSLWLWPASLVIRERARDSTGLRLLAVGLAPVVIAYSTYTWPWNFASFFLLSSLWLLGRSGLVARIGVGISLGAALLAHPATSGYVLGIGLVWLYRHRAGILPGAVALALVVLSAVPWMISVTGGGGPQGLVNGSIPALAATTPVLWAVSRLLILAHTFFPEPIATADRFWPNLALEFFVLSLPGALLTALVAGRLQRPPKTVVICLVAGAMVALALFPAGAYRAGMLNTLYPGVLILLTFAAGAMDATGVRRMFVAGAALGGCTVGLLLWLSASPIAGDPNLDLRSLYGVTFFVQRWGVLPGLAVLAAAAYICARTAAGDWRQPELGATAG
jgi:hypothetical protein